MVINISNMQVFIVNHTDMLVTCQKSHGKLFEKHNMNSFKSWLSEMGRDCRQNWLWIVSFTIYTNFKSCLQFLYRRTSEFSISSSEIFGPSSEICICSSEFFIVSSYSQLSSPLRNDVSINHESVSQANVVRADIYRKVWDNLSFFTQHKVTILCLIVTINASY